MGDNQKADVVWWVTIRKRMLLRWDDNHKADVVVGGVTIRKQIL